MNTVAIIIKNSQGKYLAVSRRNDHSDFGLPGGKCEGLESPFMAASRELREETGLTVNYFRLWDTRKWTQDKPCYKGNDTVFCFIGYTQSDIELPSDENRISVNEGIVRWKSKEQLYSGCFGEYNRIVLSRIKLSEI